MSVFHKNALPADHRLAEYTIESVLGHGGFGITYLAHDRTLGAQVAIKEYLPHEIANRDNQIAILPNPSREAVRDYHAGLKNFVKEARALARFKHPNIVRVLRFLEANSTAYMVMEYEQGTSLADYLKQQGQKLDEPTLLRIFIPILNGLHAVHEAGMLHLDIKPENIYLRQDGSPILIDFGSARQAISSSGQMQRVALTHGYAPMEQYPDKGKPGPATDIYAIGASMYRCISGKHPEPALERYQAVLKYQVDPLTPATKIGEGAYRQHLLECIDWALQIYPQDRPQSARELQDGLMGKSRSARPGASQPQSINRPAAVSSKRASAALSAPAVKKDSSSAAVAWLAAGLMLTSLTVAAILYWGDFKINSPPLQHRPPAAPPRVEAQSVPIPPPPASAPTAGVAKRAAPNVPAQPVAPIRHPSAPPSLSAFTLTGHQDWVQAVAISPDGKWLASGSSDQTVKLWEMATGTLLGSLRHGYVVNAITISSDGAWLASAGDDGTVRLWDGKTGAQRGAWSGQGYAIFAAVFSPDAKLLAAAGKDRSVFVWRTGNGDRVHTLDGHTGDIYALAFSPDGKFLASAGADKKIRIWNVANGQETATLPGHKDKVLALVYSPDGKWLASGDTGEAIRIWDAAAGAHLRTLANNPSVLSLAYSPDSRWLAAGLADKTIRLFDKDGTVVQTLNGHQDYVQALAFSADGAALVSGSRDKSVKIWKSK